jgi:hypothetical protein
MKIIQKTSDRLIIQENNISQNLFILAFVLFVGLISLDGIFKSSLDGIFKSLPRHQTLNCQRIEPTQVNCRVEKYVIGIKSEEITSTQVTSSEVIEQEESTDETSKVYQIKLYTKTQSSDFGETTRDEAATRAISNQINTFLATPQQPTFQVSKVDQSSTEGGVPILFILFVAIFVYGCLGLAIWSLLYHTCVETWDFDKTQHQLEITQWFLIKRKTKQPKQHSLLGQLSLKIDDSQKDSEDDTLYKLNLILNSGEKIILYFGTNKTKAEMLSNEIGHFLNLKLEKV